MAFRRPGLIAQYMGVDVRGGIIALSNEPSVPGVVLSRANEYGIEYLVLRELAIPVADQTLTYDYLNYIDPPTAANIPEANTLVRDAPHVIKWLLDQPEPTDRERQYLMMLYESIQRCEKLRDVSAPN